MLRENAACGLVAAGACATLAWVGLSEFVWNDYEVEAQPAVHALVTGHLLEFLRLAPSYGGSLVERAPFALLPGVWGGGELAVYRMLALPCLLAVALLAVYLVARMRADGASRLARAGALGICVANPVALRALELGHAEELLGGCLCVAAVLLAAGPSVGRARALAAGAALGLAIANKDTALLAAGPVLAALPRPRRALGLASALACAGALLAPLAVVSSGSFLGSTRAVASVNTAIFQPWQVWWFFGHHGSVVRGLLGAPKPGYRAGAAWTATISHPLILLVGAALGLALLLRSHRRERLGGGPLPATQALLALALVLLLRCMLDTWDTVYYPLPFIFALLAWEVRARPARPPLLALSCCILVWASFLGLKGYVSPDAEAAFFLAWTVPLVAWMCSTLLRRADRVGRRRDALAVPEPAQEMTVRVLGRPVSTS